MVIFKYFPVVMVVLDIIAAVFYLLGRDWWRAVYWLAAGILTLATIFIK